MPTWYGLWRSFRLYGADCKRDRIGHSINIRKLTPLLYSDVAVCKFSVVNGRISTAPHVKRCPLLV